MLKKNYKFILGIIIGLLFGSIGIYAAIKYNASEIGYKDKTVEQALNTLYETKDSQMAKVYGVKRDINSSSSSWTRINDSVGLVANAQTSKTAVRNDFDNIYPWSDIKSYNYNPNTKQITAWYGEEGFEFDGSNGEVLTYIPEFYYKREQKNGYEYVYISKTAIPSYEKSEAFSIGRYTMSADYNGSTITKVHSRSGQPPVTNQTITEFRELARKVDPNYVANNANHPSEFSQLDYHYFIIQLLYLVEYADYNSQAKLGLGNVDNSEAVTSEGCNDLGMKSGTLNNDGKHSMIYRGMEDIYGNIWQFVDGINIQNNQAYINYNPTTYAVDIFSGNYHQIGYVNVNTSGYIKKLGYDANNPLVAFPIEVGGSESTYIPDNCWLSTGNLIVRIGGDSSRIMPNGLWTLATNINSSNASSNIGARLLKTN